MAFKFIINVPCIHLHKRTLCIQLYLNKWEFIDPLYILYGCTTWLEYRPCKKEDIIKKYLNTRLKKIPSTRVLLYMQSNESAQITYCFVQSPFLLLPCTKINKDTKFRVFNSSLEDICFPIKIWSLYLLYILFLCFNIHTQDLNTLYIVLNKWHKAALYIRCYNNCS